MAVALHYTLDCISQSGSCNKGDDNGWTAFHSAAVNVILMSLNISSVKELR